MDAVDSERCAAKSEKKRCMNDLFGETVKLEDLGEIGCVNCGRKGQYPILDVGVINMRKYTGLASVFLTTLDGAG